jgi:uncharacterized protein (TIGR02147 family)
MKSIYHYTEYREFLKDFYEEKKTTTTFFSYRYFSQKAGFKSPNQLQLIMQGKRNLTDAALFRVAQALALSPAETEYFKDLAGFGQAKNPEEKNFYYQRILDNKKCKDIKQIEKRQYEYLSTWYHSVLRELAVIQPGPADALALSRQTWPPLSPAQVKKSLELMEQLGLLEKNPDGTWRQTSAGVTTGPEASALAVTNYHKEMLTLAKKALTELPPKEINICGLTLGVSPETYQVIRKEVQQFQEHILHIASQDQKPEQVYQLNLQLFPLSRKEKVSA